MEPQESFSFRVERVRSRLAELALDAAIFSYTRSMYYLTGFNTVIYTRPQYVVLSKAGQLAFVVPKVRELRARSKSFVADIHGFSEHAARAEERDPILRTCLLVREMAGPGVRIGLELDHLPVSTHARFAAELKGSETVDISALVRDLRMVKDPWEVANIRKAARITEAGMEAAHDVIMGGGTEIGANVAAEHAMARYWAEHFPEDEITGFGDSESIVASSLYCWTRAGANIALSLPASTHKAIAGDEPVLVIIATMVNGYAAEYERTIFRDAPTGEVAGAYAAMMAAREAVYPLLKPGTICEELMACAKDVMARHGFETGQGFLGHGLGLGHHERPHIVPGTKTPLAAGMVLAVEPAIFRPQYGVTQSDTVLITETGYETLTDPKRFIC